MVRGSSLAGVSRTPDDSLSVLRSTAPLQTSGVLDASGVLHAREDGEALRGGHVVGKVLGLGVRHLGEGLGGAASEFLDDGLRRARQEIMDVLRRRQRDEAGPPEPSEPTG